VNILMLVMIVNGKGKHILLPSLGVPTTEQILGYNIIFNMYLWEKKVPTFIVYIMMCC